MLAGRLLSIINTVVTEYNTFKIVPQLQTAFNLSANRGNDPSGYVPKARVLREWADDVLNNSSHALASVDVMSILSSSEYSSALPRRIAKIIKDGFPDDINKTISSSEISIYLTLASSLLNELTSYINVAKKLNIDVVSIPENNIGLDVFLPRNIFDNKVNGYVKTLLRFSSISSYFIELTTGSKEEVDLTYLSTSDPVTGIALVIAAATPLLVFYKQVLEVAEKQFNLLKTIKEFRNASLEAPPNLDEQIKSIIEENLKKAVDVAVASAPHEVPEERVAEISIALAKDGGFAVQAIANGARIGVTVEAVNQKQLLTIPTPVGEKKDMATLLREVRALEHRVDQALTSYGEPAPLLLSKPDATQKSG